MPSVKISIGDSQIIQCDWHLQPGWNQTLTSKLPAVVAVRGFWTSNKDVRLVLHVLTGGPCLAILPSSETTAAARKSLEEQHEQCLTGNKAAVASASDTQDLLLVAQSALEGESPVPVFLVYVVARGAPQVAATLMEDSQLPLLLDLDETLLSAFTANGLKKKIEPLQARLTELNPDNEKERKEIQQLVREVTLRQEDHKLLEEFSNTDAVTLGSQTYTARLEEAKSEAGLRPVNRPVIRLPNGVVLTRIDPNNKATSMLFRTRPGWHKLRLWLEGQDGGAQRTARQRFQVYVCTAAERMYALEAWRHLDPEALLIPYTQRQKRFVCVPGSQRKDVATVMGLPGHPWSHDGCLPPNCAMPLAIIIDDRKEVWNEVSQGQIYKVEPFHPHQHAAMRNGVTMHDEDHVNSLAEEMSAVQDALCKTRGWMYHTMMHSEKPKPLLKTIQEAPPLQIRDLRAGRPFASPEWLRICTLISFAMDRKLGSVPNVLPTPSTSSGAVRNPGAAQPPAAAAATASLKPVDPQRGCGPEVQSGTCGPPARAAVAPSAGGAAASARQRAAVPAKVARQPASAAAAARAPDLTRRGSNALAGPSGAPPKATGRSRAAVDPRMMAAAPSKPPGPAKPGRIAAPGRGQAQPAAPRRPHAPGAAAAKPASAAPPPPVKTPAGQTEASSAHPGRKRALEEQGTSADKGKQPLMAANGKRRGVLSADAERAWLQLRDTDEPSSSNTKPADATNASAVRDGASEAAAERRGPAAVQDAGSPEPRIFSVQIPSDEDGAAQAGPSNGPDLPPSASSGQQNSQLTPGDTPLSGLGGSCLPVRSPLNLRGRSKFSGASSSVSSPTRRRAGAPAGPPEVTSNGLQATAASAPALPSAAEGDTSLRAARLRAFAARVHPREILDAGRDELPAELRALADEAGQRLYLRHWYKEGEDEYCASVFLGGRALMYCQDQDLQTAKKMAIKAACKQLHVTIYEGTLPLQGEEPVSARTAIHRVEHLYPRRLEWATVPREDGNVAVQLSLDKGEVLAEAWAQTQMQAKRKVALRLLLELGCPLMEAEDRKGVMASSSVELRMAGAGRPTSSRAFR